MALRSLRRKSAKRQPYPHDARLASVAADDAAVSVATGDLIDKLLYDGLFLVARAPVVAAALTHTPQKNFDVGDDTLYLVNPSVPFAPRPATALTSTVAYLLQYFSPSSLDWVPLTNLWVDGFQEENPPQWYRATLGVDLHGEVNGLANPQSCRGATLLTVSFNRPGFDTLLSQPVRQVGDCPGGPPNSYTWACALVGRRAWPRLVSWLDCIRCLDRPQTEAAILSRFSQTLGDRYQLEDSNNRLNPKLTTAPLAVTVLLPGGGRPGWVQFDRVDTSTTHWSESYYCTFDRVPPLQRYVRPVLSRHLKDVVADPAGTWKAAELATLL